jgi:hypothetical protein
MKTHLSLLLFAASCSAGPLLSAANGAVEKRQLGGLGALLAASLGGKLGEFMGKPEASMCEK